MAHNHLTDDLALFLALRQLAEIPLPQLSKTVRPEACPLWDTSEPYATPSCGGYLTPGGGAQAEPWARHGRRRVARRGSRGHALGALAPKGHLFFLSAELIGGHIPRKIRQGPVQEVRIQARLHLFFPPPRPRSGSWQKGQRRGGRARGASSRAGRASRLRPPAVPPDQSRGGGPERRVAPAPEVGVKVRATLRTGVWRIGDDEIAWTPEVEMAQVVQRPLKLLVPIGGVTAAWTGLPLVVATMRTISGGGRSAIAVIPAVGSGRYAPGPNMAVASLLA